MEHADRRAPTTIILFLATLAASSLATRAAAATPPRIFWASDPVRPGETVMVHGSDLGDAAGVVEMARLDDGAAAAPTSRPATVTSWTRIPVLQAGDDGRTLKFAVPAAWKPGVFTCRVTPRAATTTEPVLLNAPDPWWVQGDEGDAASPGGWLRVFGKSLTAGGNEHAAISARLEPERGEPIELHPKAGSDDYGLRFEVPAAQPAGKYTVRVHNGFGGPTAWRIAGTITVAPAPVFPTTVFNVLDFYGPGAVEKMRTTLVKYNQPADRTEGIQAALKKAKDNGGGVVYFPAGRYMVKGPIDVPPRTVLRGEGMGVVTLWWGTGHFNLDGGDARGRARVEEPKPPSPLIGGADFAVEDMSLYLPLDYEQGIVGRDRLRLARVRVRVDHYWLVQGRGGGTVARLGRNFQVTDCDILAKGDALVPGQFGVIARNKISSNKSNTPMGSARGLIVEDNRFVSMDPTAYQNISGIGRDIYYARNRHEALYAHQADYSFTFDGGAGTYLGGLSADGTHVTLATDPIYPQWAPEKSEVWRRSAVFILDGRGAGQWRDIVANKGRAWEVDRPFDVAPDATSVASIVTFNGRVLVVHNRFEDANWVNAGYGTSIDVVYAGNELYRCADLMNHGLLDAPGRHGVEPSWHVQYFDNAVAEGETKVGSSGPGKKTPDQFAGPLTRWIVHRRHTLAADNGGSISIAGNAQDVIVDGCTVRHPLSRIKVDAGPRGVLFRANQFDGPPAPRYAGDGLKNALPPEPVPSTEPGR